MSSLTLARAILDARPCEEAQAVDAARRGLTDYIASCLLARNDQSSITVRWTFGGAKGRGVYTTHDDEVPPERRALLNGFLAHALDIDDAHAQVRGHPSAPVLSALLACAAPETDFQTFLSAYIVGTEVMARLGVALNAHLYDNGWHTTSLYGGIGGAAALCRLYGLSSEMTAQAMGGAATQASGLRAQFGTPVKPLHVGFASRNAVTAVQAVRGGLYGQTEFLFAENGFLQAFGGLATEEELEAARAALLDGWGENWRIYAPGLWFKRYPFCSAAMEGCDAATLLRSRHAYTADEIEKVEIGFLPGKDAALCHRSPSTGEEGRFSIEYIVRLCLLGEPCDLSRFSPTPIDGVVREELRRYSRCYIDDPNAREKYTRVTVTRRDGSVDSAAVTHPKGSPRNPLSWRELLDKLGGALNASVSVETYKDALRRCESEDCLAPLLDFLRDA